MCDTDIERKNITLCRLCLISRCKSEKVQFVNIFNNNSIVLNLSKKIHQYLDLQVKENDGLPASICTNCLDVLIEFNHFRDKCQYSNKILRLKRLNGSKLETIINNDLVQTSLRSESDTTKPKLNTGTQILQVKIGNNTVSKVNDLNNSIINSYYSNIIDSDKVYCKNETNDIEAVISPPLSQFPKKKRRKKLSNGSAECRENDQDCRNLHLRKGIRLYKVDESVRSIIGNNVYKCDICCQEFTSFIEYFDHQESHNGHPVFKCNKCDEVFNERIQLVKHESRHKVPCKICNLEVLPKSMTAHLLIHSDVHKCTLCSTRHTSNASLEKHMKARHKGIKGFVCHICGKQSSCQSSMNRHMAYHSNERPYKCKYCEFCAKSLNIVQVHTSRKHFAEKCVCEICAKIFKSQPSLLQHMKRIHTTRKHVCDICGKPFIERYNLIKHLKKHASQRLHECKTCHKEFFTVRHLKEHRHSHRQGCVKCPSCGKEFFYRKYLHKHLLKCSNVENNSDLPINNVADCHDT